MKNPKELKKIINDLKAWKTGPGSGAIQAAIEALEDMFREQSAKDEHTFRAPEGYPPAMQSVVTDDPNHELDKIEGDSDNNPDQSQVDQRAARQIEGGTEGNPRLNEPEKPPVEHPGPISPVHGKINTTQSMPKTG